MKSLTSTIALITLMTISLSASAKSINPFKNATTTTIVDSYIQATALGNSKYSEYLFSEDFKHILPSNVKSKQFSKKQLVTFLKKQEGYVMNCNSSYKIVDQNKDYSVAKVTLTFPNFTRTDYVTMSNYDNLWVITQVLTSYSK